MIKKILIFLLTIFIIYLILFHVFDLKTVIMKKIYPQKYSEIVNLYAKQNEIDPLLIFAIIKAESNFNPNAKSHSEAIGLMQLMEKTAIEMSNRMEETISVQDLYEPEINIKLGTSYFATLMRQYENVGLALTAYNAGMGRVAEWIEKGVIKSDGSDLENIPYSETNIYVRKILNDYRIYQELYGKEG